MLPLHHPAAALVIIPTSPPLSNSPPAQLLCAGRGGIQFTALSRRSGASASLPAWDASPPSGRRPYSPRVRLLPDSLQRQANRRHRRRCNPSSHLGPRAPSDAPTRHPPEAASQCLARAALAVGCAPGAQQHAIHPRRSESSISADGALRELRASASAWKVLRAAPRSSAIAPHSRCLAGRVIPVGRAGMRPIHRAARAGKQR